MKPVIIKDTHFIYVNKFKRIEAYKCLKCGFESPYEYAVKNKAFKGYGNNKIYGTHQLMKLWAYYNFRKHIYKCWGLKP